jgi:hypothetical protein
MTDLSRLKVSLTKHGAHKVAPLLKKYRPDRVLRRLSGSQPGINIEAAQARATLAARDGVVPPLWFQAKRLGPSAINALVFVAIVLSHHRLLEAMRRSQKRKAHRGTIVKGRILDGKEFTNFSDDIKQLGFSARRTQHEAVYDLDPLYRIPGLGKLVAQLLALKLRAAGWEGTNSVVNEAIRLKINEAFSLSNAQFKAWLSDESLPEPKRAITHKDTEFFFGKPGDEAHASLVFKAGHRERKGGHVAITRSSEETEALLLHNEMQNSLFKTLAAKYGKKHVGTERRLGGMAIDIVVKRGRAYWFYEIKTADSARGCIRQAIPQLMEYSYWPGNVARAEKLFIVGPCPATPRALQYLEYLRQRFSLPLYFLAHKVTTRVRNRIRRAAAA